MKKPFLVNSLLLVAVFLFRWQILQIVAWTTMFARYSLAHGPADGWRMTFDGQHPCALCHAIASGGRFEASVLGALAAHPALLVPGAATLLFIPVLIRHLRRAAP